MNIGDTFDILEEKLKTGEFNRMDDLDVAGYEIDGIEKVSGVTVRISITESFPDCSNCFETSEETEENNKLQERIEELKEVLDEARTVCTWALEHGNLAEESPEVHAAAEEVMEQLKTEES